jgi:hypothetical protein
MDAQLENAAAVTQVDEEVPVFPEVSSYFSSVSGQAERCIGLFSCQNGLMKAL